jgi:ankyrin repeat protein
MQFQQALGVSDVIAPAITGNMTLLHAATYRNRLSAVQTLLKAKADPEALDDQDMSCLMVAASMAYPNMIRTLHKVGSANPCVETPANETALHMIGNQCDTEQNRSIRATARALLECKADPNSPDVKGRTPLFSYAILDAPSAVDLLCSRGADPMHRDQMGMTPLHALFEGCSQRETAALLVKKYHADVDAKDSDGMTALMHAAKAHVYVNVRILLQELNANPLLCNNEGRDALWLARNEERLSRHAKVVIQMLEAKVREWSLK